MIRSIFLFVLSIATNFVSAQNTTVSDSVRAMQRKSVIEDSLRELKWKKIAELKEKDKEEKRKLALQKKTQDKWGRLYSLSSKKVATGNCSQFIQTPGPIKSFDQQQMIINSPGYYYFTENVKWSPNHCPNQTAILILADNVTLDLQGFSLEAKSADSTRDFVGINVHLSKNVVIKNGIISGMTFFGVNTELSQNVTLDGLTVKDMNYYNVTKNDSLITPCGIMMSGVNTFTIRNCHVHNIRTTSSSCAGIQIVESKNGNLLNDTISTLRNLDGSVQGYSYIHCDSIETKYCHASSFQSFFQGLTSTMGHTVLGFIPSICQNLNFENCSAEDMIGSCDDCHGMSVFLNNSVTINRFSAKRIVDGTPPYLTGAKATGLEIYGDNVMVTNCTVDSIIAIVPQDLQSTGFSAWGNNITFQNCIAKNVIVQNETQQPDISKGYGTGFGWAPDPRTEFDTVTANQVLYQNCQAINCQLGFDTWFHTNSTWENNSTQNCELPILVESNSATRVLVMNKCSESPSGQPIAVTLANKARNNKIQSFSKSKKVNKK